MDLPILILAAGQSSRMRGVDKLLEPIAGHPVLARQIAAANTASDCVYVAVPSDTHPRTHLVRKSPAHPVIIASAAEGVGATLRDGVAQLPPCPAFMIVLADLVDLTADDLTAMVTAHTDHPNHLIWRGTTETGKPGHPIIFDASLRPAFASLKGDTGGAVILREHAAQTHKVILAKDHALFDLDTPEDWAAWRARGPH